MANLIEHFTVGGQEVVALSDGAPIRALGGFFHGVDAGEWTKALGISSPDDLMPFNYGAFLLRTGGHTVLIDSGLGEAARAIGAQGGGELLDRLREAGVRPDEVTDIVHTHLHADHCGWDATSHGGEDDGGQRLTFENATIHVAQKEIDHWLQPSLDGTDRAEIARLKTLPARTAGRIVTFEGEVELLPGITTIPTPGHTPGHTSFLVTSQGQHLLIVGDAAHHPIHFEHHDWLPAVDLDPAESTRSRGKLSALAVDRDAVVTGGHFPILTLGRIRRGEGGYRWQALER